jgi:hypothetical protein
MYMRYFLQEDRRSAGRVRYDAAVGVRIVLIAALLITATLIAARDA